jgi:GNAT superfamily N-acetyltransferase
MRGLRLFVRPIDPADHPALTTFLARNRDDHPNPTPQPPLPAWGLLGKLLGDVVAVVALEVTEDAVRIDDILVAADLRRKWIGRVMLREVEQLATRLDRHRIVVENAGDAHEFFRRVGFQSEGERWVRVVP